MRIIQTASMAATAQLSLVNGWLSHRVSSRISPFLLVLAITAGASAGSIVARTRAPQSPQSVPADFATSHTQSLAAFLATLCEQTYGASFPAEAPFLGGNALAMSTMMSRMAITPTGKTDADFVHMMVPHHQAAIDMAVLEIHYGKNPVLKRLAQEIIVDQQQEIAAMYLAIHEPLPASVPAPTWNVAPSPTNLAAPSDPMSSRGIDSARAASRHGPSRN